MLWPLEFLESFRCSISSISIYHGRHRYTRVKSYVRLNLPRASVFNFECLDILWTWISHPTEMLWPFEFLESLRYFFSSVWIYHGPHIYSWVKSYGCLNLQRAFVFNFEGLDILFTWIGDPIKKLGPFEFLEILFCSFSSVSICHGFHTYIRVKSYCRLNLPRVSVFNFDRLDIFCTWITIRVKCYDNLNFSRASVVQFWASWYIMGLTHTLESKVMVVWIFWDLPCTISRVLIYYESESVILGKSLEHLNFSRACIVHFQASRYMRASHIHPSLMFWPFEYAES